MCRIAPIAIPEDLPIAAHRRHTREFELRDEHGANTPAAPTFSSTAIDHGAMPTVGACAT
ncbi:hypothetical protein BH11MYX2_BH11MYX2_24730 [soil metagenome]